MKFNKSWLAYIGVGALGIAGVLYMMYKRSKDSMAQVGTDIIIGTGGMDNSPTDDKSKGSVIETIKINPHDAYGSLHRRLNPAYDGIDSDWVVNF